MPTTLKLLRSCSIEAGRIYVDGHCVFTGTQAEFSAFSTAAYKALELDYPKFHKMDNLSKLGFLTAECLLSGGILPAGFEADQTGIVVANAHSSTDTDLRYNAQVQQSVASPALFVYTLPNIVLGEICIRHGLKGENTLFVAEQYDAKTQVEYVTSLFEQQLLDRCVGGWVDFYNTQYRAFFYLAALSTEPSLPEYTTASVAALFNS